MSLNGNVFWKKKKKRRQREDKRRNLSSSCSSVDLLKLIHSYSNLTLQYLKKKKRAQTTMDLQHVQTDLQY